MKRFGKTSSQLLKHKTSFFEENELHLEKQRELAAIYKKQPLRVRCKNCTSQLSDQVDFTKDGIGYTICAHCTHLNGIYQDTDEYCEAVYTRDDGKSYAKNYQTADVESYHARVRDIYAPKAEFLLDALRGQGEKPKALSYLDFGAGSGYLVAAFNDLGLENVLGTDVSRSQAEFGNAMIGREVLQAHSIQETQAVLKNIEAPVVCMIGTLEHLQHPRDTLRALNENDNVKYLFVSLPMFSLAVYLEILSPDVFHRQLHGGHTHLYTERSLAYLCEEFGFERIAEWWFGTDIVDLFRHVAVALSANGGSERMMELWQQNFGPLIDPLQLELDKKLYSSQVHVLLKKRSRSD